MNLPFYVQLIYAFTAMNYFVIAYFFFRTQDGMLRKLLIVFFTTLGVVASLRCFERYSGPFLDPTVMAMIVGLPMLITTSILVYFLHHYKSK